MAGLISVRGGGSRGRACLDDLHGLEPVFLVDREGLFGATTLHELGKFGRVRVSETGHEFRTLSGVASQGESPPVDGGVAPMGLEDDLFRILGKEAHVDDPFLAIDPRFDAVARNVVSAHLNLANDFIGEPELQ